MARTRRYAGHVVGSRSTLRITSAEGKRRARIGANLLMKSSLLLTNSKDILKSR